MKQVSHFNLPDRISIGIRFDRHQSSNGDCPEQDHSDQRHGNSKRQPPDK